MAFRVGVGEVSVRRTIRLISWVFFTAYAVALLLALIGTFGLLGAQRDPLSGIFLLPLGLPWNFMADLLPLAFQRSAMVLAPLINLAILRWLSAPRVA